MFCQHIARRPLLVLTTLLLLSSNPDTSEARGRPSTGPRTLEQAQAKIAEQQKLIGSLKAKADTLSKEVNLLRGDASRHLRAPASSSGGCSQTELATMRDVQNQISNRHGKILELQRQLKNRDSQIDALIKHMRR